MANNDNEKNKKPFFKDFKAELKKVTWPTPKQIFNNTMGVLTIVVIVIIIVFILDITFDSGNKYGINKLKGVVDNSVTENVIDENTVNENSIDENTVNNTGDNTVDNTTVNNVTNTNTNGTQ